MIQRKENFVVYDFQTTQVDLDEYQICLQTYNIWHEISNIINNLFPAYILPLNNEMLIYTPAYIFCFHKQFQLHPFYPVVSIL